VAVLYSVNEISEKLRPIFEAAPIYKAILFGSYAKGTARAKSDIDIVIDSKGQLRGLDFFGVLEDVSQAFHVPVDLLEISQIIEGDRTHDEITKTGVTIYERV